MRSTVKWLRLIPLIVLCGCAGTALRNDYSEYSDVYAKSVNRQLLLNLARLSHDEPPYFVQLGQISSQYTFSSSVSLMPSHARITHPNGVLQNLVQDNSTFGGSVGAG